MFLFGCGKKELSETDKILANVSELPYIEVHDDYLDIVLKENQTTNAIWSVEVPEGLKLVIDDYVVNENKKNMVGVGGRHVYRFEGISSFTGSIVYQQVSHSGQVYPDGGFELKFINGEMSE